MAEITNISLTTIRTALNSFGTSVKGMVSPYRRTVRKPAEAATGDEFQYSDSKPRTSEQRAKSAVEKNNAANEKRLIAEINKSAEFDNIYDKLLQEYRAYSNPELNDAKFNPVSEDTVSAEYRGKQVRVKFNTLEDGSKQHQVNFNDGSKIDYVTYTNGGKRNINGEEFELPSGTVVETKSVNDRVFSQLIQLPNTQRKVVNKPEYLDKAEEIIAANGK